MKRWEQGRAQVDRLIAIQRVDRIAPNRPLAERLLVQAAAHVDAAVAVLQVDAPGAFQLSYDAARKALAAILVNQGLRAKGDGAHMTLLEVARAQLHPPLGSVLGQFDWMRRLRNDTEYPDGRRQVADASDVEEAVPVARQFIDLATRLLDEMPVY